MGRAGDMPQTENTLRALQRDKYWCRYCLAVHSRLRRTWTGHHILGRARSDEVKDIISLCNECHGKAEAKHITKEELYAILNTSLGPQSSEG